MSPIRPDASTEKRASGRGLRFSASSPLVTKALDVLEEGPLPADELARRVLDVTRAPVGVAGDLVRELLLGEPRVEEGEDGRWRLASASSDAPAGDLSNLDYVVVDVETTGGSPRSGDRVTEIAAVQVSDGRVVGEFSSLVNPGRSIPPWITRLTGISQAMVADAPPFAEVAGLVRERMEGRIFVAHNAPFDWRFVRAEMRRACAVMPVGPQLCTLRLARKALPDLRRKGLDAVTRHFGIDVEDRHRAAGDALATADVLLRLLSEVDRQGVRDWPRLEAWLGGRAAGSGG